MKLHPALRWALLATLLISAWMATRTPEPPAVAAAAVPRHSAVGGSGRERAAAAPRSEAPTASARAALGAGPASSTWPAGPRPRLEGWPDVATTARRAWGPLGGEAVSDGIAVIASRAGPASGSGTAAAAATPASNPASITPAWRLVGQLEVAPGRIASTFVQGSDSVVALPGEALDAAWQVLRAEPGSALLAARRSDGISQAAATEHWLRLPEAR